jgi:hypothetical protein
MACLVPIRPQISTIFWVTPEALPEINMWTQLMEVWSQSNRCLDKFCPNPTSNIHNSSGYAGAIAQIQHVNTIKGKSPPNPTTNIHYSSGYSGGAAQIAHVNTINDKSHPN